MRSARVLLIDEDDERRHRVISALSSHLPGSQVTEICNGLHYAEHLVGESFDVAIAADHCSWGDGPAVLSRLKRYHPKCRTVLFGGPRAGFGEAGNAVFPDSPSGIEAMALSLSGRSVSPGGLSRTSNGSGRSSPASTRRKQPVTVRDAMTRELSVLSAKIRELGADPVLSPHLKALTHQIAMTGERLDYIKRDLAGSLVTKREEEQTVSVGDVLLDAMRGLQPIIRRSKARVLAGVLPNVVMSRQHLFSLFFHLLDNALKFHGQKPPRATVRAHELDGVWIISVSDNGIGISQALSCDLFEMYVRAPGTESYPGSGVGLAICRSIAECYDGSVWYESKQGRGSTFYARLKVAAVVTGRRRVTVLHNGEAVGEISVSALDGKRQIVRAALALPQLHAVLDERTIKDMQLLAGDVVNVVS